MKRCKGLIPCFLCIILASLSFFAGCGIPTYLSLDRHIRIQKHTEHVLGEIIGHTISIDASGITKINEMVDEGPSIKFFYLISSSNSENNHSEATYSIRSLFNSHVRRTTGNGLLWYPSNQQYAPGFYLFTPKTSSIPPLSLQRPSNTDMAENSVPIVLGTFSLADQLQNPMYFFSAPLMDIDISDRGLLSYLITIEPVDDDNGYLQIQYDYDTDVSQGYTLYGKDLQKELFPLSSESARTYIEEKKIKDEQFFSYLPTLPDQLYLHIWVSVYGGKGAFTNLYWSELSYVGYLSLW